MSVTEVTMQEYLDAVEEAEQQYLLEMYFMIGGKL